ncbi:MAG TPA: asparagine synthase (glutamine-hydrolyzing) [Gemmatimonadaceae bacterium]|nr:asparagine synthase (glutamine-hydrolyzing) [Gemmatimonadaceae bacterium]
MCGIAGVLERSGRPVERELLRRMGDVIAHRGPDGEGQYVDGPVGLVNRRLAIIDPTPAGAMPMTSADGRYCITYNGEVYNFADLRPQLEAAGYRFRSHTDTEVVLNAYAAWGPACVERFNGMFAFAIWDRERSELFLARDRFGVKPLYYADLPGAFLFGSEIKSMLEHDALDARVSAPHLLEYFTFQNIFTDGTLFTDVRLLRPGHHLTVRVDGGPARPRQYWDFDFRESADGGVPDEEYEEELDRLFRQAVRRQLVSDVPVGAHLSGGMDSGSITALAAEALPYLNTFTVGFDMTSRMGLEVGADERAKAEAMSYQFRTEHYEVVLKSGDMERCLPDLVWHLEDPRVGQCYPNYYGARLAGKFVKVALSGSGGDELFAGYPWRYYRAVVNDDLDHYVEKYYSFWHRLVPNAVLHRMFAPHVWDEVRDLRTIDIFRDQFPDSKVPRTPEEYVNHSLYLEAKTFLPGLFVVEDKLSMAHSLESRVPFLDNDLVDFAQRVPVRLKLRDLEHVVKLDENTVSPKNERYFERTRDGKLLLRRVMRRYVPESVTNQIKQGFSGPDASWFRGDSIDYVRRIVLNPDSAMYEFLNPATVRTLVDDHLEGRANRRLLLWSLLTFEHWCQTFLHGARP